MAPFEIRLIQSFDRARLVNEVYWNHTIVTDTGRQISVENLRKAVERIVALPVIPQLVESNAVYFRGNMERYADRIEIKIVDGQGEQWTRFTFVKELCHALCDHQDEWTTEGVETLRGLVKAPPLDKSMPAPMRSERFAELIALELLYPFEFREADVAAKKPFAELAKEFGIPLRWVESALEPGYIEACGVMWSVLLQRDVEHEKGAE